MARKTLITVPSETAHIREVSTKILENLAPYGASEDALFAVKLGIEEAVRNAIVHGNKSDKHLSVKVSYSIDKGAVNIEVEDEGKGFDPNKVPDPTRDENLLKGSGRGVYLIKKLMDRVEFNEAGNIIKMSKRLR